MAKKTHNNISVFTGYREMDYSSWHENFCYCCFGWYDDDLRYGHSREEAEAVLSGNICLKELFAFYHKDQKESLMVWVGDNDEFVVANEKHPKEVLKKYLRGFFFSGHRNCPGSDGSFMLQEALDSFCPGWHQKMEDSLGPSSWRIDVHVKEDGAIIARIHRSKMIISTENGSEAIRHDPLCYDMIIGNTENPEEYDLSTAKWTLCPLPLRS